MSPFSAVGLLHGFIKFKTITVDEETFDEAFDALTSLLERANNEKHRVTPRGEKEDKL